MTTITLEAAIGCYEKDGNYAMRIFFREGNIENNSKYTLHVPGLKIELNLNEKGLITILSNKNRRKTADDLEWADSKFELYCGIGSNAGLSREIARGYWGGTFKLKDTNAYLDKDSGKITVEIPEVREHIKKKHKRAVSQAAPPFTNGNEKTVETNNKENSKL